MSQSNLKTVKDYAALCGVTSSAIYHRAEVKKLLEIEDMVGPGGVSVKVIDMDKYPPKCYKEGVGKKKKNI